MILLTPQREQGTPCLDLLVQAPVPKFDKFKVSVIQFLESCCKLMGLVSLHQGPCLWGLFRIFGIFSMRV